MKKTKCNEILTSKGTTHPEKLIAEMERSPRDFQTVNDGIGILAQLLHDSAEEVRHAAAKSSGNVNRQKAAERVIKSAKKQNAERVALHGAWMEDGKQCICDCYEAFRLSESLPLESIPENVQPLTLARLFPKNQGEPLTLPTIPELKSYIITEKARKKIKGDKSAPVWDFGDGLPMICAEYLLNALELLPDCVAIPSKPNPEKTPIYFESSAGDGIICPIRKAARI